MKLNLKDHSDEEIVRALLELSPRKLIIVMQSVGKVFESADRRSQNIAKSITDDDIQFFMKRLMGIDGDEE